MFLEFVGNLVFLLPRCLVHYTIISAAKYDVKLQLPMHEHHGNKRCLVG